MLHTFTRGEPGAHVIGSKNLIVSDFSFITAAFVCKLMFWISCTRGESSAHVTGGESLIIAKCFLITLCFIVFIE